MNKSVENLTVGLGLVASVAGCETRNDSVECPTWKPCQTTLPEASELPSSFEEAMKRTADALDRICGDALKSRQAPTKAPFLPHRFSMGSVESVPMCSVTKFSSGEFSLFGTGKLIPAFNNAGLEISSGSVGKRELRTNLTDSDNFWRGDFDSQDIVIRERNGAVEAVFHQVHEVPGEGSDRTTTVPLTGSWDEIMKKEDILGRLQKMMTAFTGKLLVGFGKKDVNLSDPKSVDAAWKNAFADVTQPAPQHSIEYCSITHSELGCP